MKVENSGASDNDCKLEEDTSLHWQKVGDSGYTSPVEEAKDRPRSRTISLLEEDPSSNESPEEDINDQSSQLRTPNFILPKRAVYFIEVTVSVILFVCL